MKSGGLKLGIGKENITENLQFFLDAIEKPIAVIDEKGMALKVNHAFLTTFEVGEQSCMKQIIASEASEAWHMILKRVILEKKITCKIPMVFHKKHTYTVDANLRYDEETEQIVFYMYVPYESVESFQHYGQNMFNESEELVMICDSTGQVKNVNEMTVHFFDKLEEDVQNNHIDKILLLFPENTLDVEGFKEKVRETGYAESLRQFIHPSGHIRYYKISAIKDFITNLYLVKFKDKTEETILQQQLAHKGSLLEVGQLAASVAHEIRNPITTLKGFTQLLKATAEDDTLKYLNVIDDEIQRMELILSEMLNLSKPSALQKEKIPLNHLLSSIVQVIYPKAKLENIHIVQEYEQCEDPYIYGEEGKLKQIFLNLLKNSLEAMKPGGILSIYTQKCSESSVNIMIKDTGKGIDEQSLNQIFMPYFTTRVDGTGLGLPFVLKTVEDHGGNISVSSEVGKGTNFILTFPIVEPTRIIQREKIKEAVC